MRSPTIALLTCLLVLGACKDFAAGYWDFLGGDDIDGSSSGGSSTQAGSLITLTGGIREAVEGRTLIIRLVRMRPDATQARTNYATQTESGSTATAGLDYESTRGTLRWGANEGGEKTIEIKLLDDSEYEEVETFLLRFSETVGRIAMQGVVCSIRDSMAPPKLWTDVAEISASKGNAQTLFLRAGTEHAARPYLLMGSFGTTPGFDLGGVHVPLNVDTWFELTLLLANSQTLRNTARDLNYLGLATAQIQFGVIHDPTVIGTELRHAYVVHDGNGRFFMASNAVPLRIVR